MNYKFKLEIITGPMFSGKTTKLINLHNKYKNNNTIIFNHSIDNRFYNDEHVIATHNKDKKPCIKVKECFEIYTHINKKYKDNNEGIYIFIDECQFFKKINELIETLNNSTLNIKHVFLSGLNYDAKGKIFNKDYNCLFNKSTTLHSLTSKCYKCRGKAEYTICVIENNINNKNNVLVGDKTIYKPSCHQHINFNM